VLLAHVRLQDVEARAAVAITERPREAYMRVVARRDECWLQQ